MLLTLGVTALNTKSSKQKDIRAAMQLISQELQYNLSVIRDYEWLYNEEKRVAKRLQETDFSIDELPIDTVETYYRRIVNGMGKPYQLLTDGRDMFTITGLASEIGNDQLVYGLLRTYSDIHAFDEKISIFYHRRAEMLAAYQLGAKHSSHDIGLRENFAKILNDKTIQGWITSVPYALEEDFFDQFAKELELLIAILEKLYGESKGGDKGAARQQQ